MLLLAITSMGWAFIVAIVLGLLLTRSVVKRMASDTKGKGGCLNFGVTALIITMLTTLVLTLSVYIGGSVYGLVAKPKYKARVVSFSSHWEEKDEKDNSGYSRTRKVLMHTPIVQFTTNDGKPVTLETNVSSGSEPIIGNTVTVAYAAGDKRVQELSLAGIGLLFGGALMAFIMGIVLIAIFQYAMGADTSGIKNFAIAFFMRFLLPFCMLFLLGGMGYALWQYFMGNRPDMPLWAVILCSFFCLVLLIVLPGFLKPVFSRKRKTKIFCLLFMIACSSAIPAQCRHFREQTPETIGSWL